MSKNDITGDELRSKPLSENGRNQWDVIFGKKLTDKEVFDRDFVGPIMPEDVAAERAKVGV